MILIKSIFSNQVSDWLEVVLPVKEKPYLEILEKKTNKDFNRDFLWERPIQIMKYFKGNFRGVAVLGMND